MTDFSYTAKSESGQVSKGTVSATNRQAAIAALNEKGLKPLTINEAKKSLSNIKIPLPGKDKVKPKDLVIFTRQFATMINAGVPLLKCLVTMRDQTESETLRTVLENVTDKVEGGIGLSEALREHPKIFSEVYINMVKAGEEGGILDQIMDRLATQVEKDSDIKGKFKGALIYPGVITVVAIGAVTFLLTSILPKFAVIFEQFDGELPIQTRMLLGFSDFLINNGLWLFIGLILGIGGLMRYIKTPKGKKIFDTLLLKVPIFGPVVLKVNTARFAQTFSSLTSAGVSVVKSLEVTSGALSNSIIQDGLKESVEKIKNGQPVSKSLSEIGIFPPMVTQMTAIGEETGQIDEVLTKVADFYGKEVDRTIAAISSIIEPVLIVGLGGAVGLIVASIFGPMTAITQSI